MSRIRTALLGLALAALTAAQAQARTEIDFWFGLRGVLGEQIMATCDRFNRSQDQYQINCIFKGNYDELINQAIAAYRAEKQPEILQVVDRATATLMQSGAIIPAHEFMANQGVEMNWADYFPSIGYYYADRKNRLWSFPFNSSTAMWYYNIDAFEKAGIKEPAKTWEQYERDLYKLKEAGFACSAAYFVDLWTSLEQFSAIHNVPIATRSNGYEGLDAELVFNTTLFVKHMEDQKKWWDDKLLRLAEFGAPVGPRELFVSGQCPIFWDSIAGYSQTQRDAAGKIRWAVAELPHYEGVEPKNNLVGGASLWTFKGFTPEEYKGVAAFYRFIATPEEQKTFSLGTGYIPVTRSAFQQMTEEGIYERPENKGRDLAVQSLLRSEPTNLSRGVRLGNYVQIRNIVKEEIERALNNEKTMKVALDDAARRGNELLRRFEAANRGKELP